MAISVKLSRKELALLRRLSFLARRTGGRKLSSNAILRALLGFMRRLDTDLEAVRSIEELKRRLLKAKLRQEGGDKMLPLARNGSVLLETVLALLLMTTAGVTLLAGIQAAMMASLKARGPALTARPGYVTASIRPEIPCP